MPSCSFISLFLFVSVYTLSMCTVAGAYKLPPNITVPTLIVFGDSIVDSGNNNNLKTLIKCNFPPYGRDFQNGLPTGRFCNGKIPSDMIAEALGIKKHVPAYLDPNLQPNDLLTGVSFASGGSGFDHLTSQIASAISLSDQLKLFKEYIEKLNNLFGFERANFILANSVYFVVASSNDIALTYFDTRVRQFQYDVPTYTSLLVDFASVFLEELYELGARRIGVFSAPPVGCLPVQRTLAGGIGRQCVEKHNEAAILYNSKLSSMLDSINSNLRSKMVYLDVYTPLLDVIVNHTNYGFEIADKGCCGTGLVETVVLCNLSLNTCENASKYVFWDSVHPTERAYEVIVGKMIARYGSTFF